MPRHQPRVLVDSRRVDTAPSGLRVLAHCLRWQREYVGGVFVSVTGGVPEVRRLLAAGLPAPATTFYEPDTVPGLSALSELIVARVSVVADQAQVVAEMVAVGPTLLVGWEAAEPGVRLAVERLNGRLGGHELAPPRPAVLAAGPSRPAARLAAHPWLEVTPEELLAAGRRRVAAACEQLIDLVEEAA